MKTGKLIKKKRLEAGIGLRKFCNSLGYDPSNWSKIERGIISFKADRKKLKKIANVLGMKGLSKELEEFLDLAEILQDKIPGDLIKETKVAYNLKESFKEIRHEIRMSVPHLKSEKFRNLLLCVLERCAGKPNVNESVLYKLLYFIDFNYYEIYEEQFSGATYIKTKNGPIPFKIEEMLVGMKRNNDIEIFETEYSGLTQKRFIPLIKPDLTKLKASEKVVIDKTLEQLSDMTSNEIRDYAQNDIPCKATKENEKIEYELVFYRTFPYSNRVYSEEDYEFSGN